MSESVYLSIYLFILQKGLWEFGIALNLYISLEPMDNLKKSSVLTHKHGQSLIY